MRWDVKKLLQVRRLIDDMAKTREERVGFVMAIALCEVERAGMSFEEARGAWEKLFQPNVALANQQRELRKLIGYEADSENDTETH